MWALICGFSDVLGEELDDCAVHFFDDKKAADAEFDNAVADGEYHFVRLCRVACTASKTYDVVEETDDV